MTALALGLWVLSAAAGGKAPAEPPPPTLAALTSESPFAAYAPTPPLRGSTETLDLSTLQRAQIVYGVQPPELGLRALTATDVTVLRQTLAADPRWRLSGSPGALVATARTDDGGAWRAGPDGWHQDDASVWRASLRFGPLPKESPWTTSPLVTRAQDPAARVELRVVVLQDAPWKGRRASAFSIEAPSVSFDMYEAGFTDERTATEEALAQASDILHTCAITQDLVLRDGTHGMFLPRTEPGAPSITVRSPAKGRLELQARANPGAEGWTWLRLVRAGRPWEELGVAAGTREVIGFSKEPTEGWWMQSVFPVPSGEGFEATAELWFLPLQGTGAPRRLTTATVQVPPH